MAFLAPHDCLGCVTEGSLLCDDCRNTLLPVAPKKLDCPDLACVYSVTVYSGVAKDLLWLLKSSGAQEAAKIMAACMVRLVPDRPDQLIIHIPTASSRVRQRGYDQAKLLAKELSKQTKIPRVNALVRHGQAHQVGAGREQRIHQLSSAFRLKSPLLVRNANIILVDDVVTTGATLETVAKIVRRAGAQSVTAITFAQPQLRIKQLHARGW